MDGTFGSIIFGGNSFGGDDSSIHQGRKIACLGDSSSHGGTLVSTNQDDKFLVAGIKVCVNGCDHSCPIPFHGTTQVTAVTTRSFVNGKLIITTGATAGCGAVIQPPDRKVYAE